jgi:hypothetical protein
MFMRSAIIPPLTATSRGEFECKLKTIPFICTKLNKYSYVHTTAVKVGQTISKTAYWFIIGRWADLIGSTLSKDTGSHWWFWNACAHLHLGLPVILIDWNATCFNKYARGSQNVTLPWRAVKSKEYSYCSFKHTKISVLVHIVIMIPWWNVDLYDPGLQCFIQHDVKPK